MEMLNFPTDRGRHSSYPASQEQSIPGFPCGIIRNTRLPHGGP